ncbi:hypothetical protein DRJ22_01155 [Candidatus Woesearchaeota archaeon]|nr:MAG: hypothetical protein B6U93_02690 [Candidatus Woesearchaeota archaeon ex4484_78]RLE46753.1 MAG: hypothetical protein DRJ22_01155 [Candidatus Woesearchaeota archaeon]
MFNFSRDAWLDFITGKILGGLDSFRALDFIQQSFNPDVYFGYLFGSVESSISFYKSIKQTFVSFLKACEFDAGDAFSSSSELVDFYKFKISEYDKLIEDYSAFFDKTVVVGQSNGFSGLNPCAVFFDSEQDFFDSRDVLSGIENGVVYFLPKLERKKLDDFLV